MRRQQRLEVVRKCAAVGKLGKVRSEGKGIRKLQGAAAEEEKKTSLAEKPCVNLEVSDFISY